MPLLARLVLACLLNMTLVLSAMAAPRLWVVLSEDTGAYAETAAVLRAELGKDMEVTSGVPETLLRDLSDPPDLIVTVGVAAIDATLERLSQAGPGWSSVPLLATLVPQTVFDARLAAGAVGRRPVSAVVLDQPLGRQLALIRRALPDVRRVGVLPGPQTRPLLRQLASEATARKLSLVTTDAEIRGQEQIFPVLKSVLEDAEVILALPDPLVYNGATLQNILLTTYRSRTPLVAFSPAYVKAGAVLALYSTPTQVARGAAGMVRQWVAGKGFPPPRAPQEFAVVANAKVAASLGIALEDAATVAEALRREEGRR